MYRTTQSYLYVYQPSALNFIIHLAQTKQSINVHSRQLVIAGILLEIDRQPTY